MKILKIVIFSFLAAYVITSCANIVPLTGGDKDATAPEIVRINPGINTVNFATDKLEISFNEYIVLDESKSKILFSPIVEPKPKVFVNGKKLLVKFKEGSLKPNTTYKINMNGVVKDFNEGNVRDELKYVFSTGSYIDSLQIEGNIINAFNNLPFENISVALYKDSVLYDLIKTKTDGAFKMANLKAATYSIIAFSDDNFNTKLDSNESAGFLSAEILLKGNLVLDEAIRVSEPKKQLRLLNSQYSQNKPLLLAFNQQIDEIELNRSKYSDEDKVLLNPAKDSLSIWFSNSYIGLDTFFVQFKDDLEAINLNIKPVVDSALSILPTDSLFSLKEGIKFRLSRPLGSVNKNLILLTDTSGQAVNFSTQSNDDYILLFPDDLVSKVYFKSGAVTDMYNFPIKSDSFKVNVQRETLLGNLVLTYSDALPTNLVVELYNDNDVLLNKQARNFGATSNFDGLQAGKYKVRVFVDDNANNEWDRGDYYKKTQPEEVILYSKEFEVLPNWDYELNIE